MTASITATRPVAPFEAFGRELMWEGTDLSTGVVLDRADLFAHDTIVTRPGKGDRLVVDLAYVLHSVAIAYDGHGETRGYISTTIDGDYAVMFVGGRQTEIVGTIEAALVELAFEYIS